ncbi:hypothetical protein [Paraburkholderia atlantica]|uniref:hypothetical protein n=1 Tax=Paraburkholderia atlantica TaxID=2654982 RepID=UPI0012FF0120|nr:hypothetical protein [Paraburkholderia atlantica]
MSNSISSSAPNEALTDAIGILGRFSFPNTIFRAHQARVDNPGTGNPSVCATRCLANDFLIQNIIYEVKTIDLGGWGERGVFISLE